MSFLRRWLRPPRPAGVGLHPSASIEVDAPRKRVHALCLLGIEQILGGAVRENDEVRGTIEASFGLVNSERMICTLETLDEHRTQLRIESRRGAVAEPIIRSDYVQALRAFVESSLRKETDR